MLEAPAVPLLRDARFFPYAFAKLLQQIAQNAFLYGMFILIVRERESAFATSGFVIATTLPSLLLSLPGGVAADALPRKLMMVTMLVARAGIAWWALSVDIGIGAVLALAFAVSVAQQFYGPAEGAALASVVARERMGTANTLVNTVTLASQLLGAGIVAPIAIKAGGDDALLIVVFALLVAACTLVISIPDISHVRDDATRRPSPLRALPEGWRAISADDALRRVTILAALLDAATIVVLVAAPAFLTELLDTQAENAVYIFAPGALGVVVGLLIAPVLLAFIPPRVLVFTGFTLLVGVITAAAFLPEIARELDERTFLPLQQAEDWLAVRREIAATALLLPIGGFGLIVVRVASRTATYRRAPDDRMAQVIATQSALGSVAALLPAFAAGALVDLAGVRAALLTTGVVTGALALVFTVMPARGSQV